jgi:Amt family ammonium transporter
MVFFERVAKIDDPVGAISVHGTCGIFGVLALGIFADGTANYGGVTAKGLLFGDGRQFLAQCIGAAVCIVWAFGASFIFFKILSILGLFRSKPEDELAGWTCRRWAPAYPLDPGIPEALPSRSRRRLPPASALGGA